MSSCSGQGLSADTSCLRHLILYMNGGRGCLTDMPRPYMGLQDMTCEHRLAVAMSYQHLPSSHACASFFILLLAVHSLIRSITCSDPDVKIQGWISCLHLRKTCKGLPDCRYDAGAWIHSIHYIDTRRSTMHMPCMNVAHTHAYAHAIPSQNMFTM